jgi:hypothetical protein
MTTPAETVEPTIPPAPVSQTPPANPAASPLTANPDGLFTKEAVEAAVQRAREQEHTKVYSQLEDLRAKFDTAESARQREADQRATAEVQAAADAAAAAKAVAEEEMSAKELAEQVRREANEQVALLTEQLSLRDALLDKERERARIEEYKLKRVAEESEPDPEKGDFGIMPQIAEYITGSTEEEVEHSIATAKVRTAAIMKEMHDANIRQRASMPGVGLGSGPGNADPMSAAGAGQVHQYTAEEIAAMPVNSPEYQKARAALGVASAGARNHGMFG